MNITEFLLERIDQDERHARKLAETDHRPVLSLATTSNHPQRLLAECDAKRAILHVHTQDGSRWEGFPRADKQVAYCLEDQHASPCLTLQALAAIYSDHEDYRQEWTR